MQTRRRLQAMQPTLRSNGNLKTQQRPNDPCKNVSLCLTGLCTVALAYVLWYLYRFATFTGHCCEAGVPWRCILDDEGSLNDGKRLRIGFVTYATGPYFDFIPPLWSSLKQHAFNNHEVHLFLFTDKQNDTLLHENYVHFHHLNRLGWPFDSMGRYYVMLKNRHSLEAMDYLISLDADLVLTNPLRDGALGDRIASVHAWFFPIQKNEWTHDRRRTVGGHEFSTAYIEDADSTCYFTGQLFGGRPPEFFQLVQTMVELMQADLARLPPRIALWHDESYLNKALLKLPPTVVWGPHFTYPEPDTDKQLYWNSDWRVKWQYSRVPLIEPWMLFPKWPVNKRKFLNLSLRKHDSKQVKQYHPLTASLPPVMLEYNVTQAPARVPYVMSEDGVLHMVTFLVHSHVEEHAIAMTHKLQSVGGSACAVQWPMDSPECLQTHVLSAQRPFIVILDESTWVQWMVSKNSTAFDSLTRSLSSLVYVIEAGFSDWAAAAPVDGGDMHISLSSEPEPAFDSYEALCASVNGSPQAISNTALLMLRSEELPKLLTPLQEAVKIASCRLR